MKLGTGLFTGQRRPDDDRSTADIYGDLPRLASETERAGLASFWVSEHHFQPDGYLPGSMPALGAMAAATEELEIGSCVALAPLYDPVRLAEDAATAALVAGGGRLTLGLALGSNPDEFAEFGVDPDDRVSHLEDALAVCRGAWSDGPLDYDSPHHPISPDTTVTPKPDGDIPIALGGSARPAVRRAAREADAWIAPSAISVDGVRKRVADIRTVRADEGLDGDFQVYVIRHGFVGDSADEAWETVRDGYLWLQRRYQEIFTGDTVDGLPAERREELREQAVVGTPEEVVEQLEPYRDAVGDDVHVILRTYHPGLSRDEMTACIHRLGDEVAPHL